MFVKNVNIMKQKKRMIFAFLVVFGTSCVVGPQVIKQYKSHKLFFTLPIVKKKYTLGEKHLLFEELGQELKSYGLRIGPKAFADACMIALYCESNLKTTSIGGSGSQGINQLTAQTRKKLGIPDNILDDDFETQLGYFKKYLIASEKIHLIKDAVSLHALNFSPSNPSADTFCIATNELVALDLNQNGSIDREDFKEFQRKRTSQNKYIKKIYEKRYGVEP